MRSVAVILLVISMGITPAAGGSWHVPVQKYYIGPGTPTLQFGDFNGDHITDLFILREADSCAISLLFGRGDGTFDLPAPLTLQGFRQPACGVDEFLVFDANGDGLDDVALRAGGVAWIMLNSGSLAWNSSIALDALQCLYDPQHPSKSFGLWFFIGATDCDRLHDRDLLAFGYREDSPGYLAPRVLPYINNPGTSWTCMSPSVPNLPYATATHGDFNNDGFTDIIMRGQCTVYLCVLYGDHCSFSQSDCWGVQFAYDLAVGDFNGDGFDDLFWMSDYPNGNFAYGSPTGLGSKHFYYNWPQPDYCGPAHTSRTFVGDFNGDGLDDLGIIDCARVATDNEIAVYCQISSGDTFIVCDSVFVPAHEKSVVSAADLNGDRRDDLCYFVSSDTLGVFVNEPPVSTFLRSFEARLEAGRAVVLAWEVKPAVECASFAVWRAFDRAGFELLGRLRTEPGARRYQMVDADASARHGATVTYRLETVGRDGSTRVLAIEDVSIPAVRFTLHQNIPNPFNPTTTIAFELPARTEVWLDVFDVSGKLVRSIVGGQSLGPGTFAERWDGLNDTGGRVSSGIYYCRLRAGKNVASVKMVVVQ